VTDINRLTCEEVFRRLDDYLDRELSPDEMQRMNEHLETCEVCAREHKFEKQVLVDLRDKLRRVSAPGGLLERINQNLDQLKREGESQQG
jgi:anti-sigma factor (TIGR02949 family)